MFGAQFYFFIMITRNSFRINADLRKITYYIIIGVNVQ